MVVASTSSVISSASLLRRSPLLLPIHQHNPDYRSVHHFLFQHDRFCNFAFQKLQYDYFDTHCLVKRDPTTGKDVTQLMLFPFRVTLPTTNVFGTLHGGMLMTMVDLCTSLHIGERLLPAKPGHVSVNLSTNFITAAQQEDTLVAVTRIDKIGKRLAYTSVDFLLDNKRRGSSSSSSSSSSVDTVEAVEEMLQKDYVTIAQGKHVKSIITKIDLQTPLS